MIYKIELDDKIYEKSMGDGDLSDYEIIDVLCSELDDRYDRNVFISEQSVAFYKDNVFIGTYSINRHRKSIYSIQEI